MLTIYQNKKLSHKLIKNNTIQKKQQNIKFKISET